MPLDPGVLDRPHPAGARRAFQALLAEAVQALRALEEERGAEALHDFRVALRRLRSVGRSFRRSLAGAVRGKHRRELRAVAAATSGARDAEVQLAWIARVRERAPPRDLAALAWLSARLEERRRIGGASEEVARRFRRLARELERSLERRGGGGESRPFGRLLARTLRAQARELLAALDAVSGPWDVEQGHAARIAAKRLRYLLELVRGCGRTDPDATLEVLKELQAQLGELHDAHVFGDALADALTEVATEGARGAHAAIRAGGAASRALRELSRGGILRGLVALDERAAERAVAAHAALRGSWPPARRRALARAVGAVADALSEPSRSRHGRRAQGRLSVGRPSSEGQP